MSPRREKPAGASKPTDTDRSMMRRALRLARQAASIGETPIAAVIYDTDTGEILAEAHNTRETQRDPLGHAELLAIRDAARAVGDWRLNHCTLVVTLEPCPMCAGAIVNARVGRLVYGAPDPKAGAVNTLFCLCNDERLNHRLDAIPGVMASSSARLLKEFFRERREANKRRSGSAAKRA